MNEIINKSVNEEDILNFKNSLSQFNILLSNRQMEQFLLYYNILIEWNSFMNLTAITDFSEVLKKHFIDSLSLVKAVSNLSEKPYRIIDIGTGAGFPGIPLKIVFENLEITLLDSLNKRINFLKDVIDKLNLKGINAVHGRAEDYANSKQFRESYDICVSRAVANMSVLSEYCIPFIKKDGYFISYKSEKILEEYNNAKKSIDILGGKLEKQVEFVLPDSNIHRNLFIIKKIKSTPLKYPRKAGIPSKEPL